ncbi:MAG: PqqD family protein [Acidimicrobiia bacterium]|jgi:hypothetical protein
MADARSVVYARRDDVLWRRSLDSVVLLPVGADEPVSLPGTGAAVWDLLAEPSTLPELVDALVDVYGGDPSTIERDVAALLERLRGITAIDAA